MREYKFVALRVHGLRSVEDGSPRQSKGIFDAQNERSEKSSSHPSSVVASTAFHHAVGPRPCSAMEHWGGSVKKALGPHRAGQDLKSEERSGTYSDRVRQTPSLSTDEDALSRLWRARLIIAKLVSLHAHAQDLALIDVQALGFGSVEQFVSRSCFGARKPEIRAFVGIAVWCEPKKKKERGGIF
jgi:hypothetical protein